MNERVTLMDAHPNATPVQCTCTSAAARESGSAEADQTAPPPPPLATTSSGEAVLRAEIKMCVGEVPRLRSDVASATAEIIAAASATVNRPTTYAQL